MIPTFNRPHLLRETLDSVLAQSCPAREIIVVDNGTGDETQQLLDEYGPLILPVRIEPSGVQRARNVGTITATSTWIAFLDDDDLYRPTFVEAVSEPMTDSRVNMIVTDHRKFDHPPARRRRDPRTQFELAPDGYWDGVARPEPGREWSFVGSFPPARLLRYNAFYPSTMVVRKALVEEIGGFDPAVRGIKSEDMDFTCRAIPVARVAVVWKDLVDYRVHESNTSGDWLSKRFGRWRIFERVHETNAHGSAELHSALEEDLPGRRRSNFDLAFLLGQFDVVIEAAPRLRPQDWTPMRRAMLSVARRVEMLPPRVLALQRRVHRTCGTGVLRVQHAMQRGRALSAVELRGGQDGLVARLICNNPVDV